MAYHSLQKLKDNIAAIRIAFQNTIPSAEELEVLQRFSGFGGIKAILYPNAEKEEWKVLNASKEDLRLYEAVIELHELIKEKCHSEEQYANLIQSLKSSVLTAFYTPDIVPKIIFEVFKEKGIEPNALYEPSAGAGIFITEAMHSFPSLQQITAVEKDIITGAVLEAICRSQNYPSKVHVKGLEETSVEENGKYDLVVSNIPFGNFAVHDSELKDPAITNKIHNFFFAKGLQKIGDGGLLAFITTDAFLNTASNQAAREYLFRGADFISLTVLPDNLMKETGNTEAPSHLLVVQKNTNKEGYSPEEKLLVRTVLQQNEFGPYRVNAFILEHPEIICGDELKAGTNQYGTAHQVIWQHGDINNIREKLRATLEAGITRRFDKRSFDRLQLGTKASPIQERNPLTFLDLPATPENTNGVQLGLFNSIPAENVNRALAYINESDKTIIQKATARIVSILKTTQRPEHESIVLLTAKSVGNNRYLYKLYSNVKEISYPNSWMNGLMVSDQLERLSEYLKEFDYEFQYEGDKSFEVAFKLHREQDQFTDLKPHYKKGTLVIHKGEAGIIENIDDQNSRADFEAFTSQPRDVAFYREYVALRDGYFQLYQKENSGIEYPGLRQKLNEAYKRFHKNYGDLNSIVNKKHILNDSLGFISLSSLERKEGGQFIRSDIFYGPLFKKQEVFTTDDPVAALARCLNEKGRVDIFFMAQATALTVHEIIKALEQHVYINPGTLQWETVDQYLSGNVVEKLKTAEDKASVHPDDIQFQRSLEAIKKVQPEKIPFELLDFNLGERWMPVEFYHQFATYLFETETKVNYLASLDCFKVSAERGGAKVYQEFAVTPKNGRTVYGTTLLEHALENTSPFFTYELEGVDGKNIRVPDNDATQMAHQKIESIRNKFVAWLNDLPEKDKRSIESIYNDLYNCYVLRQYNGSHLSFPGLDKNALGIADLYESQKNSAWRIIQNRGALIDHEVGLGKTLTMVAASHEMKRLGIVHKPLIIALKANVSQIAETYQKAFPHAKILFPGEHDFTPAKRQKIFHAIKNNNWDCIILTHDQFGKIPQSPEIQRSIFQTELDNIEKDLKTLKELGGSISKQILKGLEVRKNNLSIKLKDVLDRIEQKKDVDINFGELGIDHLFVDESHKFKNLTFTTRHNRVAGLGNVEGSQKALNMLFAVRSLQQNFGSDLCVTFLSGTPISNSLTEMYLLFKYLRPNEMRRQHIENFDGWAAVFAKKTTDFEFSVTNEIIAKERFRHFIKVPELALFYNEITDYKTARHIKLDKPNLEEQLVNIQPTEDQKNFIKNLMAFARTGDATLIGRSPLTPEEDKGRMLIATNYAKKMAVDMRLIDPEKYDDDPGNKISVCAKNLSAIYIRSIEHKGTQIVFCDIGTPKKDEFNLYDTLKEKLVTEYNVPAHEISFIHDWTDTKKPELFRKMNTGQIRILIGSTEKAGTGLNVQQRVVAMHHLDIPWKPSELEQRNGRGARQGNIIAKEYYDNKVQNFIYAVEQSLDNYKFNLLKNKQTFISQMKNCALHVRTIDEGAMDEKTGMNFSEYIAILSGDTTLLEKSKFEKKIAVVESLKAVHFKEITRTRFKLEQLQKEKESASHMLSQLQKEEEQYKGALFFEKDGTKANPVQLHSTSNNDPEVIGRHVIDLYTEWKPTSIKTEEKIGSLYGFDLYIRQQRESYEENGLFAYRTCNSFYVQHPEGSVKYTYNNGHPSIENPRLAARYFINALERISRIKERYEKEVRELCQNIPVLQNIIGRPFEKEEELKKLKEDHARLEKEITLKLKERDIKQAREEEISKVAEEQWPLLRSSVSRLQTLVNDKPVLRIKRGHRL